MPTFKPAVLGAAFLALSAYAQPDPRDVDPDEAVLSSIANPCAEFDLECILSLPQTGDPCDRDPSCTGSSSEAENDVGERSCEKWE